MKFPTALILTLLTTSFVTVAHATNPPLNAPNMMSVQAQNQDVNNAPMDAIQDGGFGMTRKGVYWGTVESKRGTYDFTSSDAIMSHARARNLFVSMTLYGNNRQYEDFTSNAITTAAGRRGFAAFAAAVVARYRGQNVAFEVWNEPNIKSFWGGPSNSNAIAAQYVALLKEVVPAMRRADPDAYISVASISTLWNGNPGSFQWFDECVRLGMMNLDFNAISQHPYGVSYPEQIIPHYQSLRSKMNAAVGGRSKHITNTEVGYHLGWIARRQVYTAKEAEDVQGWMIVRQNLVDIIMGLKYSNWYEFRHSDEGWAVVSPSLAPNPVYRAAQNYREQLNGYRFLERVAQTNTNNYIAIFRNVSTGRRKAVVWTGVPHTTATIRITGVAGTGTARSVNTYGTARTYPISSGAISVAATNQPQYIDIGIPGSTAAPAAPSPTPRPSATPAPTPTPAAALRNVVLNKVPVVSSGSAQAARLTDGVTTGTISTANRWNSAYGYPQTITIAFGRAEEISQVRYLQQYQRTSDFRVEIYAGGKWTAVVGRSGNKSLNIQASFKAVRASAVRLTILKGTLYQRAYEIQVMGK